MKKYFFLVFLLFISNAEAFSSQSLTWQKVALEEKIQRKISNSLSAVLKDNQYLIEVEAEVSDPGQPNLGNNKNKTGPKISEIEMSQSSGDYIAFSKVGLEVPVLEKYFDEDKNKLMNLYRFNEAYDIFKNLDSIKINVWLSDKINPQLLEIAKKVINNTKLSLNGVKPTIKIDVMELEYIPPEVKKPLAKELDKKSKPKIEKEPKIWAKDWYEWASRWGNAVGLVLASLIIAFSLISLFKQYKALMDQLAQKKNSKEENDQVVNATGENPSNPDPETPEQKENALDSINGFSRFKEYLIRHPESAIHLIREWISIEDENSKNAIKAVSQQAESKEIEFIMSHITQAQKDKWKSTLTNHLSSKELNEANKFIFNEIVRSLLVPSDIHDGELLNLIVDLTPKTTVEFLQSYEAHVPVMMNIIAPGVLAKVFDLINLETTNKWLVLGNSFKAEEIKSYIEPLKKDLKTFSNSSESPFVKRILELIPKSKFDKEESLYKALAKSTSMSKFEEVAYRLIPSEIIDQLPASVVKEILNTFPMEKKIEIIISRPDSEQMKLIEAISAAGSTARELIDMELKGIKNDRMRFDQITSNRDEIKQDYINAARLVISGNSSLRSITHHLIESWIKKLYPGLKVVKKAA